MKISALVPHFMSAEPRPQTLPSATAPLHGPPCDQISCSPAGEDVDVPVEHEMATRIRALERAHHVRELGMGIDDAVRKVAGVEKGLDVGHRLPRVAGRVRCPGLNEFRVELDQHVSIGVDAVEQGPLRVVHRCFLQMVSFRTAAQNRSAPNGVTSMFGIGLHERCILGRRERPHRRPADLRREAVLDPARGAELGPFDCDVADSHSCGLADPLLLSAVGHTEREDQHGAPENHRGGGEDRAPDVPPEAAQRQRRGNPPHGRAWKGRGVRSHGQSPESVSAGEILAAFTAG